MIHQFPRFLSMFCGLGLLCGVVSVSRGELVWEKQLYKAKTQWDDTTINIVFPFKNSGKKPVKITKLASSCGCMTIKPGAERNYKPGEHSTLEATYEVGFRSGMQSATIYVESEGKVKELAVVLHLPQVAALSPGVLSWQQNAARDEKIMRIQWMGPKSAKLETTIPVFEGWHIRLEEVTSGKEWQLRAKPDADQAVGMIQVPLVFESTQKRKLEAILMVFE